MKLKRKFRESDQEESYFDGDDEDDEPPSHPYMSTAVDEVAAQDAEGELHRTPRMFSLSQAPLLNSGAMNRPFSDRQEVESETKQSLS